MENNIQKDNIEQLKIMYQKGIIEEGVPMNIPIERLSASGFNTFEVSDIDSLVEEILAAGLITPLTVIGPFEDGNYRILSGERRITALKQIHDKNEEDYAEVPCYVVGKSDMPEPAQKLILEIANEAHRQKYDSIPHRFAIVKHVLQLSEEGKIRKSSVTRISAEHLGMTKKYARCFRDIVLSGNANLENLVLQKKIDVHLASLLAKMDGETMEMLIDLMRKVEKQSESWKIYNNYKAGKKLIPDEEDEQTDVQLPEPEIHNSIDYADGGEEDNEPDNYDNQDDLYNFNHEDNTAKPQTGSEEKLDPNDFELDIFKKELNRAKSERGDYNSAPKNNESNYGGDNVGVSESDHYASSYSEVINYDKFDKYLEIFLNKEYLNADDEEVYIKIKMIVDKFDYLFN